MSKKNNTDNINTAEEGNLIEMSYDETTNTDIVAPTFRDIKNGKNYVDYGNAERGKANNNYPDELLFYKNNCSLHGSILDYKIAQIAGRGFLAKDDDKATLEFLDNINDLEDSKEILDKVSIDLAIFGGFSLIVLWDNGFEDIVSIKHIGFNKVRSGKLNDNKVVDKYYYKYDWSKGSREEEQEYQAFNGKLASKIKNSGYKKNVINEVKDNRHEQLLYFKPYDPSSFFYPLPKYVYCINAIATSIDTSLYSRSIMTNGMAPHTVYTLYGQKTPAQHKKEAQLIIKNNTGARRAGSVEVLRATNKELAPDITEVAGNGKDTRFNDVNANTIQEIITGHRTSPILAGYAQSGAFGNPDELNRAYEKFYTDVVVKEQNVITKVFNKLMDIKGLAHLSIDKLGLYENLDSKDNNSEVEIEDTNNK